MTHHMRDARWHVDRIEHYANHAAAFGYSQAVHHQHALNGLLWRAARSKRGNADVLILQALIDRVSVRMREMKEREGHGST